LVDKMTAAHQLEASFDQVASHLELALPIRQRRMQARRTSEVCRMDDDVIEEDHFGQVDGHRT
jgi:hypothetical protein